MDTLQPKEGQDVPSNGDINTNFGVYKNLCCGEEIVIPEGKVFPDCRKHPNLPTVWKSVAGDKIVRLGDKSDSGSAA